MRCQDEIAFLFALKEKLCSKEAAPCDWTDVCGDLWSTRRCLGLTGAESCHFRISSYPVPSSRSVGSASLSGQHSVVWSEQMVLEEVPTFDTNLNPLLESCSSLSPKSPSYVPQTQRTSYPSMLGCSVPAADACIFSMSFLGSVPPDEHTDSRYAC